MVEIDQLRAHNDRLIVQVLDPEFADNGLILSHEHGESPGFARVLDVGALVAEFSSGDIVFYDKSMGSVLPIGSKEVLVIRARDIHGVLENPDIITGNLKPK